MCSVCGCSHTEEAPAVRSAPDTIRADAPAGDARLLTVERNILAKNDAIAEKNRRHFRSHRVLALNLVSSPGAGKTALLVAVLARLKGTAKLAVIEGDQETQTDAARIRAAGVPAVQVNTGPICHLDAAMVDRAFERLHISDGIVFIENVGNLVCPAGFDLGEDHKIAIASVTEGEDKPLKYPNLFAAASLLVISKIDLLPHLDFDVDDLVANARRVNPGIAVLRVSAKTGEGLDRFAAWIEAARALRSAAE